MWEPRDKNTAPHLTKDKNSNEEKEQISHSDPSWAPSILQRDMTHGLCNQGPCIIT